MTKLTRIKFIKFLTVTVWKVSKYRDFSGPYYPAFGLNTQHLSVLIPNAGKYGPEKPPYLNTFHSVCDTPLLLIHFHQCPTFYVYFIKVYRPLFLFWQLIVTIFGILERRERKTFTTSFLEFLNFHEFLKQTWVILCHFY